MDVASSKSVTHESVSNLLASMVLFTFNSRSACAGGIAERSGKVWKTCLVVRASSRSSASTWSARGVSGESNS